MTKLQVVSINEKDVRDLVALLLDHGFGSDEIDLERILEVDSQRLGAGAPIHRTLATLATMVGDFGLQPAQTEQVASPHRGTRVRRCTPHRKRRSGRCAPAWASGCAGMRSRRRPGRVSAGQTGYGAGDDVDSRQPAGRAGHQGPRRRVRAVPTIERVEVSLHGHRVNFNIAGQGPPVVLIHGVAGRAAQWDQIVQLLAATPHRGRARPAGPWGFGQAARGLLPRRARLRHPRPAGGPRHRARQHRRPLARRRDRDAVRLPVPGALRAAGARVQRRARRGRPSDAARGDAARIGVRPAAARPPAPAGSGRGGFPARWGGSACVPGPTWPRWPGATSRSPTPRPAAPSSTRCAA